jgi:AcrR family transcriptional regulator
MTILENNLAEAPALSRASIGARRSPETEAAVLDAAQALIREEGFAKLTMEAVARRARAGKATLYRWWPTKSHLLLSLYTRSKETLPEPDTGDLEQDLTEFLTSMIEGWRGETGPWLRSLIAEAQNDPDIARALAAERETRWCHLDNIIKRAAARGELNPTVTPAHAVLRVISLCWYQLLTNHLPEAEAIPAQVGQTIAGLRG